VQTASPPTVVPLTRFASGSAHRSSVSPPATKRR
jgi:hypothetical protein